MIFVGFDVPVAGKWPEKNLQFCLFFLKIWPKTYPHFYEKQRYNLEWPKQIVPNGCQQTTKGAML